MISLLLALLLLATPAAAHHEGSAGGGGGSGGGGGRSSGAAVMHCVGDGTTREGRSCNSGSSTDCDGTCANGWCGAVGDSKPCTANTDCDGTCDSVNWGRYFGHEGDCSCTTGSCGGTCGGGTDNSTSWASAPPDGGYLTCDEDSDCDDTLAYTNDTSSADPFFIHTSTDPDAALHCYSDTQGRMAITDDKLQYCDADGIKRTVLHGYESESSHRDCFLASGKTKTGSGTFSGFLVGISPIMGGQDIWPSLYATHQEGVTPLPVDISVSDMSCRAVHEVANSTSWVISLFDTDTSDCDDDATDGAQNDCMTTGNTFQTVCTITGTTGTSDYACTSTAGDEWRFTAGDIVSVKTQGPTGGKILRCSWRVCFR